MVPPGTLEVLTKTLRGAIVAVCYNRCRDPGISGERTNSMTATRIGQLPAPFCIGKATVEPLERQARQHALHVIDRRMKMRVHQTWDEQIAPAFDHLRIRRRRGGEIVADRCDPFAKDEDRGWRSRAFRMAVVVDSHVTEQHGHAWTPSLGWRLRTAWAG